MNGYEIFLKQIGEIYSNTKAVEEKKALDKIKSKYKEQADKTIEEEIKAINAERKEKGEAELSYSEKSDIKSKRKVEVFNLLWEEAPAEEKTVDLQSNMPLHCYHQMMTTILSFVKEESNRNPDFAEALAFEHKSVERMLKYIMSEAQKRAIGRMLFCPDQDVYDWICEYYALDDKAEIEAEKAKVEADKKAKAEKKQEQADKEAKKKANEKLKELAKQQAEEQLNAEFADLSEEEKAEKLKEFEKAALKKLRAEARKKAKAEEKAKAKEKAKEDNRKEFINPDPIVIDRLDLLDGELDSQVTFNDIFGLDKMF